MDTRQKAPKVPTDLSGQEREDLQAAEKGYDPEGSGLPDADDTAHAPNAASAGAAHNETSGGIGGPAARSPDAGAQQASARGLMPRPGQSGPPLDLSDADSDAPVDLDPDRK